MDATDHQLSKSKVIKGVMVIKGVIKGVRPCLLTFMAFSADLLLCQESQEWNMLGLFTT